MGLIFGPQRFAKSPWSDVAPSDLVEQGKPDFHRDCRRERHIGLCIRGEYVANLGVLAVRCERYGEDLFPISMAIVPDKWEPPDPVDPIRASLRLETQRDPGDENDESFRNI